MQKITIFDYIVSHNAGKAKAFVNKYGFQPSKNANQLVGQMKSIVSNYGEETLKDLAKIHPDKDLILSIQEVSADKEQLNACGCGSYANCEGCGGKCGAHKSPMLNLDGDTKNENKTKQSTDIMPLAMVAMVTLIVAVIITKK